MQEVVAVHKFCGGDDRVRRWIGFIACFVMALIMIACFLMVLGEMFEMWGW